MPHFKTDGTREFVTYITGPSHVRLGLRLVDTPVESPVIIRQPPVGGCNHGQLDEAAIVAAVNKGIAHVSPQVHAAEIVYIENDSPNYALYSRAAAELAKRFVSPG